jgi:hypothetical protein
MRTLMFVTLVATGLGLAGVATTSAAPIKYTPIPSAPETGTDLFQRAYWNRYGQWCSRRCNWHRCWVVCR